MPAMSSVTEILFRLFAWLRPPLRRYHRMLEAALIRQVWQRARSRCEYCQMPQEFDEISFEIDHVIARKHGGPTVVRRLDDELAARPESSSFWGVQVSDPGVADTAA